MADIMQRRNSPMIKTVLAIAGLGSIVYLIYLNHDANTKLKNTDDRAERYRRSHESLSAQLQVMFDHKSRLEKSLLQEKIDHKKTVDDLSAAKESSEKKAMADREEMVNRLSAKAKESSLLKSQYDDLRSDFDKLTADKNKVDMDMDSLRMEDKREYEQMKTQKELELATLKDTVANQRNQIEKLQRDTLAMVDQNKRLQVVKDTALSNVTKLHQDLIRVKAMSIAANTSITNLQTANKELQAAYDQSQQVVKSLQEKERLAANLKFAPNAQGQPQGNLALGGLQQPEGGAQVMNQNLNLPQGGVAPNQNNANVAADVHQEQGVLGQNQAVQGADNQDKPEKDDADKPEVPDVNDQGNFQIQPANPGFQRPVGYNHKEENVDNNKEENKEAVAAEHKAEDEAHHQVQPPNLLQIDRDGINHQNPHDRLFANRRDESLKKHFGVEEEDGQDGHDNSIKNQGPVNMQVQEPNFNHDRKGQNGLEEREEDERDEIIEEQEQGFHANQFLKNAHPNKQFAPPVQGVDEDGQIEKDSYYEEEEEEEDNNNEDYDPPINVRAHRQEV